MFRNENSVGIQSSPSGSQVPPPSDFEPAASIATESDKADSSILNTNEVDSIPVTQATEYELQAPALVAGEATGLTTGLAETAVDPIANAVGLAAGMGLAHIQDIGIASQQDNLNTLYNASERVPEENKINQMTRDSTATQSYAMMGSAIPVVGSAIGAIIGLATQSGTDLPGGDVASPAETSQT